MTRQRYRAAALMVALAVLPSVGQSFLVAKTDFLVDFSAFYCAGRAVAQGTNPYAIEPLRSCEQSVTPGLKEGKNPTLVLPVPLPGYAIGAFVPLAVLPFAIAAALWIAMLILACAICVITVSRVTGTLWTAVAAAFSLSLAACSVPLGQIVPVVTAALCLCGYFAWQRRWPAASIAALVAMLEPHVGISVCAALAIYSSRARTTLAVGAVVLAALSILSLGPGTNLEYVTQVLPAHALSEISFNEQYSLTTVLASVGVTDRIAVQVGSLWYLSMLVAGTLVAGGLFRKTRNGAVLVWIPPAFAVFGGLFVHLTQIAVALPAAILLLSLQHARRHAAALIALLLLAVPWRMTVSPAAFLAPIFPVAYIASVYWKKNARAAIIAGVVAVLMFVTIDGAVVHGVVVHHAAHPNTAIDGALPEAVWSEYLRSNWTPTVASWLVRIPTWSGLGLLLALVWNKAVEAPESANVRPEAVVSI